MLTSRQKILAPLISLVLTVIIGLVGSFAWVSPAGKTLDTWLLSEFFQMRGVLKVTAPVVIIAIDDESYAELKASPRWPFPKRHIAGALEQIKVTQPKLVILDNSTFSQLGESTPEQSMAEQVKIDLLLTQLPVLQPDTLLPVSNDDAVLTRFYKRGSDLNSLVSALRENLSLEISPEHPAPSANALINYYGPKGSVNRVSLSSVLKNSTEQNRELFFEKLVLIGFQGVVRQRGQIAKEEKSIPFGTGASAFEVEIAASLIANLLERSWIERATLRAEFFFVLGGSLLCAAVGIALVPTRSVPVLITLLTLLTWIAFSRFADITNPFWISGIPILMTVALSSVLVRSIFHAITVRRATEKLKKAYRVD